MLVSPLYSRDVPTVERQCCTRDTVACVVKGQLQNITLWSVRRSSDHSQWFKCKVLIPRDSAFAVLQGRSETELSRANPFCTKLTVIYVQKTKEHSALSIDVWIVAPWLLVPPLTNCKSGLGSSPSWDLQWESSGRTCRPGATRYFVCCTSFSSY